MCFLCAFRKGYEAASKDFEPQDLDVSVVGRSFMVTGANSGIGRATAMAIAKKGIHAGEFCSLLHARFKINPCVVSPGGTVHMVCRNKDKAEEVREDIVDRSGNTVRFVKNMPDAN